VFVVGYLGDWQRAAAVLFDSESLRGNPPPSREKGKEVAGTIGARTTGGGGLGTDFDLAGGLQAVGALACNTGPNGHNAGNFACNQGVDAGYVIPVAHTLRGEGFDASEDGTGRGTPIVTCMAHGQGGAEITEGKQWPAEVASTLNAHYGDKMGLENQHINEGAPLFVPTLNCNHEQPIALVGNTINRQPHNGGNGTGFDESGVMYTLTKTDVHAVAFRTNAAGQVNEQDGISASLGTQTDPCAQFLAIPNETLYDKGIRQGDNHASTQEANAGTLLRRVREEIGAEAFAEWGLGILDSFQSPEVLRSALHGIELRQATFSRRWIVYCALSRQEASAEGAMQSLREACGNGCPPQGWELLKQLAGQLGAYLSELSHPGAQAERFMRDMWRASEGLGLLRQALSKVQEIRRPSGNQRQSVRSDPQGGGATPREGMQGSGMRGEISRGGILRETCPASKEREIGECGSNQKRVNKEGVDYPPFQVRRLTVEECEFLMGYPRGYTNIPSASDSARYKALGNSMAVNVMQLIGQRIQMVEAIT
jgi:hypothetical protein